MLGKNYKGGCYRAESKAQARMVLVTAGGVRGLSCQMSILEILRELDLVGSRSQINSNLECTMVFAYICNLPVYLADCLGGFLWAS